MDIKVDKKDKYICTYMVDQNKIIGKCVVTVSSDNIWSITSWFVDDQYQHKGIGRNLLNENVKRLLKSFGFPSEIEYIWNGTNSYVFDWLSKNFDPVSKLPLSVMKYENADSWESHVYVLNKRKFLGYINKQSILCPIE